jgi:hypothetical protein
LLEAHLWNALKQAQEYACSNHAHTQAFQIKRLKETASTLML